MGSRVGLVELRNVSLRAFRPSGSSLYHLGRTDVAEKKATFVPSDGAAIEDVNWVIRDHERWLVVGRNGCGKTTLAKGLRNGAQVLKGHVFHRNDCCVKRIQYLSMRSDSELLELVRKIEDYGVWNRMNQNDLYVGNLLRQRGDVSEEQRQRQQMILSKLGVDQLLGKYIGNLSTGQLRKLSIAQLLMKNPRLTILDEPFDGLDDAGRRSLAEFINTIDSRTVGSEMVLISHRLSEVDLLPSVTHILEIGSDRKVKYCGPKEEVLKQPVLLQNLDHSRFKSEKGHKGALIQTLLPKSPPESSSDGGDTLIDMKNVKIQFDDKLLLSDFNWVVKKGQHWAIQGPNGAGKSVLLGLITGENVQVFSNKIHLWGKERHHFPLETLRAKLGMVSAKIQSLFQNNHQTALRTICTGFFGIVGGPCPPCSSAQIHLATAWATVFEIDHLLQRSFTSLSQGQQRLVLCARAVVSGENPPPDLLLLDEPFHGLDATRRQMLLEILEAIGTHTTIILITHHKDEIPDFIAHRIQLRGDGTHVKQA